MAMIAFAGCQNKTSNNAGTDSHDNNTEAVEDNDSTIYGVCGEGTAMHTLELITDQGDTISYAISDEGDVQSDLEGGLFAGDRMAVTATEYQGEKVATRIINLTALLGKWTSIDKNFEILEGGQVKSKVEAESHPWTSWKISNGLLVLSNDTFAIDNLGADSLELENSNGIYTFKRQK